MGGRFKRNKYKEDEDFGEGDVWGAMDERQNPSSRNFKPMMIIKDYSSISPLISSSISSSLRMIPRSSSSSSSVNHGCKKQFSAPVDIPDWSKIYGNKSSKNKGMSVNVNPSYSSSLSTSWVDGVCYHHHHHHHHHHEYDVHDEHVEEDEGDDGMVPPHEYIARKLARSQISSFSVCEGMGRTLKGRDLRKVRNAILTRTGFLE